MNNIQPMPMFGRRAALQGLLAAAAVVGGGSLLTGCGGSKDQGGAGGGSVNPDDVSGEVTIGCYQGDEVPRKAFQSMVDGYTGKAQAKINFVDHETFKNNINNYLQGNPDDLFTWFAGYRARFFANNGLVSDVSNVWEGLTDFPESMKNVSSTTDGKQILVPTTYYPWAVFYVPSVWQERGYSEPKTKDEWLALCEKMKADGLDPLAFADKGGWEAMGTFDMLNLRVNGYDFHISLMDGKEAWDGDKVKNVFKAWDEFMPFQQPDSLGRTWQEGAQAIMNGKAGMMTMGMFIGQQFEEAKKGDDLDFFIFPEFDSAIGADVVEAPTDGIMMAAKPKNRAGAEDILKYLGTAQAEDLSLKFDPSVIGANSKADQANYSPLQKKAVKTVEEAKNISNFLDRDTRPDFASTVVGPALQSYLKNPGDIDSILKSVEDQKKSIFAS